MSANECLEHKWLSDTSQLSRKSIENGTTTTETPTIDITMQTNKLFEQNGDGYKSNGHDCITTTTTMPATASPTKTSTTGFFLHQNPKNRTFLKQNTTTTNLNCNNTSTGPNNANANANANELLKDFATNKENINLSKILANRITPLQNQTATQLVNSLNKGSTTNNNISGTCEFNEDISVQQSIVMPSSNPSSTTITTTTTPQSQSQAQAQTAKHETILFPDAPTTPKVSRKSALELDTDTPSCVALVKQFQLSNGNLSATTRIDFDEQQNTTNEPVYMQSSNTRNKLSAYKDLAQQTDNLPTSYRLSAKAITTSTTNGHHSITSSTLSINTITDTATVGVQSDSTVTINCLCGVDNKTGTCCCNSSSRTALNYRKKSLAVVDNSILC